MHIYHFINGKPELEIPFQFTLIWRVFFNKKSKWVQRFIAHVRVWYFPKCKIRIYFCYLHWFNKFLSFNLNLVQVVFDWPQRQWCWPNTYFLTFLNMLMNVIPWKIESTQIWDCTEMSISNSRSLNSPSLVIETIDNHLKHINILY